MKKLIYLLPLLILAACSNAHKTVKVEPIQSSSKPDIKSEVTEPAVNGTIDTSGLKAPEMPTNQTIYVDNRREIVYLCGKRHDRIRVMYGFNGDEVVSAQIFFQDKISPVLLRNDHDQDNTFKNAGITWITERANIKNIDTAKGKKLIASGISYVNGQMKSVSNVIAQSCQIDKLATLALEKQKFLQKQRSK